VPQAFVDGPCRGTCGRRRTSRPCSNATPKAETTDKQIDALVYELYGLSDDEIAIVEGRHA
jgi:hypothetical protein